MTKTAIVTGGTRGIGAAIAKALKEQGYQVAASYAGNDDAVLICDQSAPLVRPNALGQCPDRLEPSSIMALSIKLQAVLSMQPSLSPSQVQSGCTVSLMVEGS